MRRSVIFLVVAVVGLLLASAAPASSAAAVKDTYYGIECFEVDFSGADFRPAGNTIHIRGGIGTAVEYIWNGSDWVEEGTNSTTINANENLRNGTAANWGTFAISLDGIGAFEGSWANGVARGVATDGSGMLMKTDLAPDVTDPDFPPPPGFDFCGPVVLEPPFLSLPPLPYMFTVIDPGA